MSFLRAQQKSVDDLEKRAEDLESQLSYVRALLLTMANSAYNALIVVNEAQEIIAINNSAETLFHCQAPPIGQTLEAVTQAPELISMVEDALANREEVFELQTRLSERFYRVRVQLILREGNTFICLALEDVTDLVRLNRARRDMVANISHELRTPIANIRLIIDGLFHETERPKRKKSISSLHAIALETDALLWMADELLDLSMIESGQAIIRMVEEPVDMLAEQAIERSSIRARLKNWTWSAMWPKTCWSSAITTKSAVCWSIWCITR